MFDVGILLQKHLDQVVMSSRAGDGQRRVVIALRLGVDLHGRVRREVGLVVASRRGGGGDEGSRGGGYPCAQAPHPRSTGSEQERGGDRLVMVGDGGTVALCADGLGLGRRLLGLERSLLRIWN